jgi:hypothetical protein
MPRGGAQPGAGRPAFNPSPKQRNFVEIALAGGIRVEDICAVLEITHTTFRKYFRGEATAGKTKRNAAVISALYKAAIGGNVTAQIYWTKAQMGWKETSRLEHTGKDGEALTYEERMRQIDAAGPKRS